MIKQKSFIRIGDKFQYADIIKIKNILIRVGSFAGLSKFLKVLKINAEYVILLPPVTTQAGDNYTGEEFLLWNKIYKKNFSQNIYIGHKNHVKYLYNRLKYTLNQTFNKNKTKIIKRNYIKKLFRPIYVKPESSYKINNDVRIYCGISNIKIYHKNNLIYDWMKNKPSIDINTEIKKILSPFKKRYKSSINSLNIIPLGIGNGFTGNTSNFIIHYADRTIWVDPMTRPFLALKKIKMHWDNITDYFITHVHEDHIEGLSAVLHRTSLKNKKINLITSYKIFKQLEKIYSYLFPDFLNLINHINIIPNSTLPYHHGYITVRHSHHVLKSGTLGLKIQYKNNIFALSGDTFYSEEFEKKYPAFIPTDSSWYNDCHLIFHEAEFLSKTTAHTYYTEIKKLDKKLNGKILTYHNSSNKFLLPHVQEYKTYIIKNGHLKIKLFFIKIFQKIIILK